MTRVARDARQHRGRHRRRVEHLVADEEEVLAAAFAQVAVGVERDALAVALEHRLHLDQRRSWRSWRRLGHRRERVRRAARPRADADVDAVLERSGAEIGAPLPHQDRGVHRAGQRVDAERVVAAIDQRPDVAGLEAVGLDRVDTRLRQRVADRARSPCGRCAPSRTGGACGRRAGRRPIRSASCSSARLRTPPIRSG